MEKSLFVIAALATCAVLAVTPAAGAGQPPFERVDGIILPAGESALRSATIEPSGNFAYFGTNRSVETGGAEPGQVIKVRVGQPQDGIFSDRFEN